MSMLHNNCRSGSAAVMSKRLRGTEAEEQKVSCSAYVLSGNLGGPGSEGIECAYRWLLYLGSSAQRAPQACQDCPQPALQ